MTPAVTSLMAIALNIILWMFVWSIQQLESSLGRIPPRRSWSEQNPFPYFQDWHMAAWGDWIGLSILDAVLGHAFFRGYIDLNLIMGALVVGFLAATIFHLRCVSLTHLPDAGYPGGGRTSLSGYAHLVYFFLQSAVCSAVLWLALTNELKGLALFAALVGALVYSASYLADRWAGRLAPVRI